MKSTGREHSHSEPLESYADYRAKKRNKVNDKIDNLLICINSSSLSFEDKKELKIEALHKLSKDI